jgi:hypothetical protein
LAQKRDSERSPGRVGARNGDDAHAVAVEIDAGFDHHAPEPLIDQRCSANGAALDRIDVARHRREIGAHDQKPVHALRQGGEELRTLPFGKSAKDGVCRTRDEIDLFVAQRLERPVVRKDELVHDIEPVRAEAAKLDGRDGREIRVRDEVRHRDSGDLHAVSSGAERCRWALLTSARNPERRRPSGSLAL